MSVAGSARSDSSISPPRRTTPDEIARHVAQRLKSKELSFSVEDPDAPENWPRVWFIWRGNALMSSSKGHEYFLRHYLGTHDNAIAEAIVTLLERTRTIGEGAGVVGLAALMQRKLHLAPDDKVVCVISGGNVDMTLVGRSIDYGLASSGRLMSIAVTTSDAPGQLLSLIQVVAGLGINIRHVEHRRGELHVAVGMTEVILQMETRDFEHQRELLRHFAGQGLAVRNLLGL